MAKKATPPMELTQATQMLQWLEEERRKDKANIATLEERLNEQDMQLAQQANQVQELQATMAKLRGVIAKATEFEEMAAVYKGDVDSLLKQREAFWKKERAEADRLRKLEIEHLIDQVAELEKSLQLVRRYEDDLKVRQAEEKRLNNAIQSLSEQISDLSRRSDDRVQAVTYLEEQRRSDNRRISELEQDTTELRKRIEEQTAKLLLMDDLMQKHKMNMDKALQEIKDFGKTMDDFRAAEFRREQKAKKFAEKAEGLDKDVDKWQGQTQRFIEQYQNNKRALENLEGFQSRIEKRQNEVAEMQRLAEDRLKRQWEESQTALDKDLRKRELAAQEDWRRQEQKNQEHIHWMEVLEERTDAQEEIISGLTEFRRADISFATETGSEMLERIEQLILTSRGAPHLKKKKR